MKSTPAVKNIRKYKNAIEGKPKRVTTGVDDYGNRFHVVGGKVRVSNSLSEKKKILKKQRNYIARKQLLPDVKSHVKAINHTEAIKRTSGKSRKLHMVKADLQVNRMLKNTTVTPKRTTEKLIQISNTTKGNWINTTKRWSNMKIYQK